MKNVIIFGGAGFIGTNLTERLLKEGDKVLCVDNLFTGRLSNINKYLSNDKYFFFNSDVTEQNTYIKLLGIIEEFFYNFVDEIYNFACPASPPKYSIDPIYTIHTSLAVEEMCKLALEFNSVLLHSSTSEVYGDPDDLHHPQSEDYRGNVNTMGPRACYDEGKRIAETILYEYSKKGLRCKIIRIFNTYGPYMDPNDGRVISNFICQALLNRDITIYGNGEQTRSFQYIDDLLDGIQEFIKTDDKEIGPLNLGNPTEFNMFELAMKILEMIPESKSSIIYKELPKDDPLQRKANITKANKLIGFFPKVTLEEGLKKTIEYFKIELKNKKFLY